MATYQTILHEITGNVLTITMNRPEVFNALNDQMRKELLEALTDAESNTTVRSIILRGAGTQAFCSGQDLKEYKTHRGSLKKTLEESYNPLIRKMRSIEIPIIGMINGVAAGAGLSLALACDMRIMSASTHLTEIFVRIGLVPDAGSHWFLPRMVGLARAFEYAATGRDISAEEAERVGLVNYVVSPDQLESTTMETARKLAAAPTKAIGLIKQALNKAVVSGIDEMLDHEAAIQQIASETGDHQEGLAAFFEKRAAHFRGR